jgi:WD40 repeat protein
MGDEDKIPLAKRDIPCVQTLIGHGGAVLCCAFDAPGSTLATGSADGEIRLWRIVNDEWRCVKTLELGPAVMSCQFQPAGFGNMLCTGSADNAVRVWKALKGDCVAVLTGHKDQVTSVSYDPVNGDVMCSGSRDATVRVWKASTQTQTMIFQGDKGHKTAVLCVSYNPNGDLILAGAQDKTLRLWNARNGKLIALMSGHDGIVHALAFHTQNEWVVTGGKDKDLKIWKESDGQHHKDVPGHRSTIYSLAFDRETGCILASGDGFGDGVKKSNSIWIWSFTAGNRKTRIQDIQNTHVLQGHQGAVRGLAFGSAAGAHGHLLCSVSDDSTARLWKLGEPSKSAVSKAELENARMAAEHAAQQEALKKKEKTPLAEKLLQKAMAPLGGLLDPKAAQAGQAKPEAPPEDFASAKKRYRQQWRTQTSSNPIKDIVEDIQALILLALLALLALLVQKRKPRRTP